MHGKNVLAFTEPAKTPVYDVSGDRICIALFIRRNGKAFDFFCHLKPATQERTIRLLNEREGYLVAVTGKDAGYDIEGGSTAADQSFFNEHLIGVTCLDQTLTPEQLDRVDRLNNIRVNAVGRGLLSIGTPQATEDADPGNSLAEFLAEDGSVVEQRILLADDEGNEHELRIVHHLKAPTVQQANDYKRTQKFRNKDHGVRKVVVNYKDIVKLYDSLFESIDGVVDSEMVAQLDKIPAAWKIGAIQTAFRDAERKNA